MIDDISFNWISSSGEETVNNAVGSMVGVLEGCVVMVGERVAVDSSGDEVAGVVGTTEVDVGWEFTGEHPDNNRITTQR